MIKEGDKYKVCLSVTIEAPLFLFRFLFTQPVAENACREKFSNVILSTAWIT